MTTAFAVANFTLTLLVVVVTIADRRRPEPRHPASAPPDTWPIPLLDAPRPPPLAIPDDERARYMEAIRALDAAGEPLPDGVRDAIERDVRRARAS